MAKFEDAIGMLLTDEGGYVNNPNDAGGETKFGITKRTYPNLDIKNLTVDTAKMIYRRDFWRFDGIISQPLANKIFNMYVNMGHTAIKIAQRMTNMIDDGKWGPNTEKAVNQQEPVTFISRYRIALAQHYLDIVEADPSQGVFLKGWLKRARE